MFGYRKENRITDALIQIRSRGIRVQGFKEQNSIEDWTVFRDTPPEVGSDQVDLQVALRL